MWYFLSFRDQVERFVDWELCVIVKIFAVRLDKTHRNIVHRKYFYGFYDTFKAKKRMHYKLFFAYKNIKNSPLIIIN